MLGIRYLNSIAVDLWVGPPQDFAVDYRIALAGKITNDINEFLHKTLALPECESARHIGIEIPETLPMTHCERLLPDLKQALSSIDSHTSRRITFILPSVSHYNVYQKVLFEHFSEDKEQT